MVDVSVIGRSRGHRRFSSSPADPSGIYLRGAPGGRYGREDTEKTLTTSVEFTTTIARPDPSVIGSSSAEVVVVETNNNDKDIEPYSACHPGEEREYVSIPDDVYNLFFISNIGGAAFFYSFYVFALKLGLFSLLAIDSILNGDDPIRSDLVVAAQCLLLPIAVGMQSDITATLFLLANIKYCHSIQKRHPGATENKYHLAMLCRFVDGCFSLLVNFVVLLNAVSVMGLFLNFAALHFLQSVDNIALDLAAEGFLGDALEEKAKSVQNLHLPYRGGTNWLKVMDTVGFVSFVAVLYGIWIWYTFFKEDK